MLGFSIQKILFTVFIVMAVWYGFKWIGQIKIRRERERSYLRRGAKKKSEKDFDGTEDMLECSACSAFVVAGATRACGRNDCPYPG
jgi:hypothetical protein